MLLTLVTTLRAGWLYSLWGITLTRFSPAIGVWLVAARPENKKAGEPLGHPLGLMLCRRELLLFFHAWRRAAVFLHQAAGDIRAAAHIAGMHQFVLRIFAHALGLDGR